MQTLNLVNLKTKEKTIRKGSSEPFFICDKYTMQTNFIIPQTITQVNDDTIPTIPWLNIENASSSVFYATSSAPLYCISGLWQERFRSKTSQIVATNFNIPLLTNNVLTGVEVQAFVKRKARIEDLTIQLTLNGELIGDNKADMISSQQAYQENIQQAGDYYVYGNATDLWNSNLTAADLQNSTFGVVIAYQSNIQIPHSDTVYFNQLAIRISFA